MRTVLEVDRINELFVMKHELDARPGGVEEAVASGLVLRVDRKRLQDDRVAYRCRLICRRRYKCTRTFITKSVTIWCTEELSTANQHNMINRKQFIAIR